MQRLKSKEDLKYLDKLARKHLANKTEYFRRNLHVNHRSTDVRIIRIKTKNQYFYQVKGLKELDGLECFFIYHLSCDEINSWLLNVKDSDIVYTDTKTNRVVAINKHLGNLPDFVNIWILKRNAIAFLKITIGDIVFTR